MAVGVPNWLVSSVGITGAFYALGYLVEYSYQSFLGTGSSSQQTTEYLLSAARLLVETGYYAVLRGESFLRTNAIAVLAALVGVAALFFWAAWLRPWPRRTLATALRLVRTHPEIAAVVILILVPLKMAYYDWPLLRFRHVLLRDIRVAEDHSRQAWEELVCSRIPSLESRCGGRPSSMFVEQRGDRFLLSTFLMGVFCLWGLAALPSLSGHILSRGRFRLRSALLCGVLIITLVIGVSMIPIVYARTLRSTEAMEVILSYEDPAGVLEGSVSRKEGYWIVLEESSRAKWEIPESRLRSVRSPAATQTARLEYDASGRLEEIRGFVIDQDQTGLTLLRWGGSALLVHVPRDRVRIVKVEGFRDILEVQFRSWYAVTGDIGPGMTGSP